MKRNKLVSIAAITVALGVLATGCAGGSGSSKSDSKSSGGTKTVTVKAGTGANVKPYTYVGDDNETTGYDVEVLKEVFDRLDGYDLQIEVTDIPSVFSGVTSGTYQIGVNNFSYNEERAKSYLYSYPYDKIGYVFITKKGAPEVKTFADAAGKSFAIARALAMEPELLLLDEPTSALDPELVGEVLDTIKKAANEGYTMLLVSHEMNFVKNVATRVIFLENGKIIEDGPPKEVFNHPKSDRVREFFAKINRMVEPEYSI